MNSSLPYSADLPDDPEMHRTIADAPLALVIEDTPPLGALYERYLRRMGYQVQWVATGSHGLEVLESDRPDLVLLDLNMPGMQGLGGLVQLRNLFPTLPAVIVSAEEEKRVILQTITYGAVGFITKSTPRKQMIQALQQVLSGSIYLPADIIRAGAGTGD